MSQYYVMSIRVHIVTDSETAQKTVEKIENHLDTFIKNIFSDFEMKWDFYNVEKNAQYTEVFAGFGTELGGFPREKIEPVMEFVKRLKNGSYGVFMLDADLGVEDYQCFGDAEFQEVSIEEAKNFIWDTDGVITLETTISNDKLEEIFECDGDSVEDELEDYENAMTTLIGREPDEEWNLHDCEMEDDTDGTTIIFGISTGLHTEAILSIKETFFSGNHFAPWRLRIDESSEDEVMICSDHDAVLLFNGDLSEIKILQAKPTLK